MAKLTGNLITGALGILTSFVYPVAFGSYNYGVFIYVQRIANTIFELSDIGISAAVSTRINNDSDDLTPFSHYFIYSLFVFLISFIGIFIINIYSNSEISLQLIYGLIFFYCGHVIAAYSKIFDSVKLTSTYEKFKILNKALVLLCALILMWLDYTNDLVVILVTFSVVSLLLLLFYVTRIYTNNSYLIAVIRLRQMKSYSAFIQAVSIPSVLAILSLFFDVYIVNLHLGPERLAQFGVSQSLGGIVSLLLLSLVSILIRDYAQKFRRSGFAGDALIFVSSVGAALSLMAALILSPTLLARIGFGVDVFDYSRYLLLYFTMYSVLKLIQNVLFTNLQEKTWARYTVFVLIINFAVNFILLYVDFSLNIFYLKQYLVLLLNVFIMMRLVLHTRLLKLDRPIDIWLVTISIIFVALGIIFTSYYFIIATCFLLRPLLISYEFFKKTYII